MKLLAAIDGRESYLIKEENPSLAYVEQHKAAYEKLDDLIGPHTVRTKAYEAMKPLMTPFEGTQKLNANTDFAKKPRQSLSLRPIYKIIKMPIRSLGSIWMAFPPSQRAMVTPQLAGS